MHLTLNALGDINNAGVISSAGNLSLTAGGAITNALPSGTTGPAPVMQAANNLNLQALNVVNAGTMTAQSGSVNIATANLTNSSLIQSMLSNVNIVNSLQPALGLTINQADSGVIQALNGNLGINVVNNSSQAPMTITGGSLLAQNNLNFNAGAGQLDIDVRDMGGSVNIDAGCASFTETNGTHALNMESFNVTGDPSLNITQTGSYTSTGFTSSGGTIYIDSTNGSITFTGDIDTTVAGGSPGAVTLIAGTSITTDNIYAMARAEPVEPVDMETIIIAT